MKRNIWLIGTPEFGNLGDHQISEAELKLLKNICSQDNIIEISMKEYYQKKEYLLKNVNADDILVFHGGGNIGNLWPKSGYIRRDAFNTWTNNFKVVMPQSIYFTEDSNGYEELRLTQEAYSVPNLLVVCRDQMSLEFAEKNLSCEVIKTPDIVLYGGVESPFALKKKTCVLCMR